MELKFSQLSPYVRKVRVVAYEVGVGDTLVVTPVNTSEEQDKITPFNPLGKIPALVTDDGQILYDSPVICEYLDAEFGGHRLLPASGRKRWEIMTRVALADGILDAALLVRHERLRPVERQSSDWIARQLGKARAGFDQLEREAGTFGELDMGLVAAGCAHAYVPLRVAEFEGFRDWPQLRAWAAEISQRPSFARTMPKLP